MFKFDTSFKQNKKGHMKTIFKLAAAALFVAVTIGACTKKSDDAASSSTSSYQGPGSHYTVSSSGGTYTFTKYANAASTSADFVVTATGTTVNGFMKFTVTAVTGSGGPTVGSIVYGFEVPGMALFVKPMDSSNPDQVLTAVASGTCPTTTFTANWIKVKTTQSNVNQASVDTFGTFNYAPSSATAGVASLPAKFSLTAPTTVCVACGSNTFTSATCSGGTMRVSNGGGDTATMYLTSVGAALVNTADTGGSAEFIFGMPQATVTTSTFAGTYSGLLYSSSGTVGSKLKTVKMVVTAGSTTTLSGSGNEVTDVANDTTSGSTATLSLTVNAAYPGILTGTINTGSPVNIACIALANANSTGKQVMDCAGIDSGSNGLFNFMLVSR